MAALSFMRPFTKLDLRHELRFNKMHAPVAFRFAEEWAVGRLELFEAAPHVSVACMIETGACLSDRNQAMLVVVESEDQGPEVLA